VIAILSRDAGEASLGIGRYRSMLMMSYTSAGGLVYEQLGLYVVMRHAYSYAFA